jgi:hypothetical protein
MDENTGTGTLSKGQDALARTAEELFRARIEKAKAFSELLDIVLHQGTVPVANGTENPVLYTESIDILSLLATKLVNGEEVEASLFERLPEAHGLRKKVKQVFEQERVFLKNGEQKMFLECLGTLVNSFKDAKNGLSSSRQNFFTTSIARIDSSSFLENALFSREENDEMSLAEKAYDAFLDTSRHRTPFLSFEREMTLPDPLQEMVRRISSWYGALFLQMRLHALREFENLRLLREKDKEQYKKRLLFLSDLYTVCDKQWQNSTIFVLSEVADVEEGVVQKVSEERIEKQELPQEISLERECVPDDDPELTDQKDTVATEIVQEPTPTAEKGEGQYHPRAGVFSLESVRADLLHVRDARAREDEQRAVGTLFTDGTFLGVVAQARDHILASWGVFARVPLAEVLNDIPGISYGEGDTRVLLSKDSEALVYTMMAQIQNAYPRAHEYITQGIGNGKTLGDLVLFVATQEKGGLEDEEKREEGVDESAHKVTEKIETEEQGEVQNNLENGLKQKENISSETTAVESIPEDIKINLYKILCVPHESDPSVRFVVEWPNMLPEENNSIHERVSMLIPHEMNTKTIGEISRNSEDLKKVSENLSLIAKEVSMVYAQHLNYRGDIQVLLHEGGVGFSFPDNFEKKTVQEIATTLLRLGLFYATV